MGNEENSRPVDEAAAAVSARADDLARAVLDECRTSLMMSFRYLDLALWKLPFVRNDQIESAVATDGMALYYNPYHVVARFRQDPAEMTRDYLHAIVHCIFRQPFHTARRDVEAWKIACDICTESIALEMCGTRYACERDRDRARVKSAIGAFTGALTPARVYKAIVEARMAGRDNVAVGLTYRDLVDAAGLFLRDSHDLWDLEEEHPDDEEQNPDQGQDDTESPDGNDTGDANDDEGEPDSSDNENDQDGDDQNPGDGTDSDGSEDGEGNPDEGDQDGDSAGDEGGENGPDADGSQSSDERSPDEGDGAQGGSSDGAGEQQMAPAYSEGALEQAEEDWEDIAQRVQTDLQTMQRGQGSGGGLMEANLELANRRPIDYRDFLRQFATVAEDMRLNDEEFDYVYYLYGLKLFGNMPLVEPLEYKESERVREFVIAVDTSGSTQGELVRHFLTRTYEMLKDTESFGDEVNIHIVQADAQVQNDTVITSLDELDRYCEDLKIYGMGGTDFRPVFDYVNSLVEQGEFENLRGMIYFTDGMGTFPDNPPQYDTAFVFVEEEGQERRVPPWAMRVVMDEDNVRAL